MKPDSVILVINGSPRKKSNTQILLDQAICGIQSVGDCEILQFNFAGREFNACNATCGTYCKKNGCCIQKDDLPELVDLWRRADGYIVGAPVYHMGLPARLKAAFDRLGHTTFSAMNGQYPRFAKVGGAISQGGVRYGGQELVIQQIVSHLMLLNCIPVSGNMPESYMGVASFATTPELIQNDIVAQESAFSLGQRVAELAKIIQSGRECLKGELGKEYYPVFSTADMVEKEE